jgi:hypothetical protein
MNSWSRSTQRTLRWSRRCINRILTKVHFNYHHLVVDYEFEQAYQDWVMNSGMGKYTAPPTRGDKKSISQMLQKGRKVDPLQDVGVYLQKVDPVQPKAELTKNKNLRHWLHHHHIQ